MISGLHGVTLDCQALLNPLGEVLIDDALFNEGVTMSLLTTVKRWGQSSATRSYHLGLSPWRTLCIFDVICGLIWVMAPGLVQEYLYPQWPLVGGLIGLSQVGLLRVSRGLIGLIKSDDLILWLWALWVPYSLWSALSLSHLGPLLVYWHLGHLSVSLIAVWRLAHTERDVKPVEPDAR